MKNEKLCASFLGKARAEFLGNFRQKILVAITKMIHTKKNAKKNNFRISQALEKMSLFACCCAQKAQEDTRINVDVYQDTLGTIRVQTLCTPPVFRNSYSVTPALDPETIAVLVTIVPPKIKKGWKGSISSQEPRTRHLSEVARMESAMGHTPSPAVIKRRFTFSG
jgi:hypothetical protein